MSKIIIIYTTVFLLTGCATMDFPGAKSDGTLSKTQMDIEWKAASTQCKNLYRQYKRTVPTLSTDDMKRFSEVNGKAQKTAEQYDCNQKYLTTLAVEGM